MSQQTPAHGSNLTGISSAPDRSQEMIDGRKEFPPSSRGDLSRVAAEHVRYAQAGQAVGSIPRMQSAGAKAKEVVQTLAGKHPEGFVNKLGERLAFERTGTRLYEALMAKHEAYGSFDGGPSYGDLELIRNQEHDHFLLIKKTIERLGGDPTAVTPAADVQGVASQGVGIAIGDPRVTLLEGLEVVLTAELTDNASWEMLCTMAEDAGDESFIEDCRRAIATEEQHVEKVKTWIRRGHGLEGPGEPH